MNRFPPGFFLFGVGFGLTGRKKFGKMEKRREMVPEKKVNGRSFYPENTIVVSPLSVKNRGFFRGFERVEKKTEKKFELLLDKSRPGAYIVLRS